MKVAIIFHSVCGNTYLMAKAFYASFTAQGHSAQLCRILDDDWRLQPNTPSDAQRVLAEMNLLTIATPEVALHSDIVVMGSPTYYSNVSAEMKTFMDATSLYFMDAKLAGKKLIAFTTAGHSEGGGDLCLQAINTYGQHMGMISQPIPANLCPGKSCPAYGMIAYSAGHYGEKLDTKTTEAINRYVQLITAQKR